MNDGGDLPQQPPVAAEPKPSDDENGEEEEKDTFEIDELDISDREAEDIDINHQRIKRISKLETIPKVCTITFYANLI